MEDKLEKAAREYTIEKHEIQLASRKMEETFISGAQ